MTFEPAEWRVFAESHGLSEHTVQQEHAWMARAMPFDHKDPLDRMLIDRAVVEGLTIVTGDRRFERYSVAMLWLGRIQPSTRFVAVCGLHDGMADVPTAANSARHLDQ